MKMSIEAVHERDIDLLLIKEIVNNSEAGRYIVKKACGKEMQADSVEHSRYDFTGEADIVVVSKDVDGRTTEIFIEDKIDAAPQPDQSKRYKKRGRNDMRDGKCDSFSVILAAPKRYLESSQASGYERTVSYEEIRDFFFAESYEYQLLDMAIEKKDAGYVPVKDEKITEFWGRLYSYIHCNYPTLHPYVTKGDRGPSATWIPFKIDGLSDIRIQIKADRGYTDLEIGHYAKEKLRFIRENEKLINGFQVVEAGKSLAVRLDTPVLDFHESFDGQAEKIQKCLDVVQMLQELAYKLEIERGAGQQEK